MGMFNRLVDLRFAASGLTLLAAFEGGAAFGQTAPADQQQGVPEVVVTSRLKAERIIDVPIAVSAFTAAAIDSKQLKDLHDIANFTPGFAFNSASTTGNTRQQQTLVMRGMNPPSGTGALLFVDGAPITSGVLEGFSDVERVEVLRGPQSAYFGRSTFSGAVSVTTKKPDLDDYHMRVSGDYSSFNTADFAGSVEGPILPGKLGFRVGLHYYDTDGMYKNSAGNAADGTNDRLGARDTKSVSFTLFAKPTDRMTVTATTNYFQYRDGPSDMYALKYDQANCKAVASSQLNNWFCGTLPSPISSKIGYDTFISPAYRAGIINDSTHVGNLFEGSTFLKKAGLARNVLEENINVVEDISSSVRATFIAAYHNDSFIVINDQDQYASTGVANSAANIALGGPSYINYMLRVDSQSEDHYFEGRLNSTWNSPLQWLIGVSNYNLDTASKVNGNGPTGYVSYGSTSIGDVNTTGIFGSLSYQLTPKLTFSFDGRYQWDDVSASNALPQTIDRETVFTSFQPRIIAKYQMTPDVNIYGSVSKGDRPGGFNLFSGGTAAQIAYVKQVSGAEDAFKEEEVTMYEIGTKGRLFDGRLQYSADYYYGLWDNQQVSESITLVPYVTPNVISTTLNIGKTRLQGVELEAHYLATRHLTFDGSFAYTRASVYHFYCSECLSTDGNSNVDGNQIRRVPKFNASFGAEYRHELFDDKYWFVRADDVFKSSSSPIEDELAQTGNRNILNLRAGIENKQWKLEIYGTNVLNDTHYLDVYRNTDLLSLSGGKAYGNNSIVATLADRPTVGIRASYKY